MSMNEQGKENAISVRDVTKVYRLYDKPIDRLKESVSISHKNYHRDFYALKGLSFQVKKGETVGIIGTNGSGKSTILKIITGVLTYFRSGGCRRKNISPSGTGCRFQHGLYRN